ncbi:retron St85 family RNA-directed DNA polymerase [Tardiphaga sp. 172_B4_N1_3]|uniref:retron St85 family RNA-directed DNA polymerase n=1 Tax=Tardiphaga sp. 172_B4_N1_3 TaxID=3240787 RepID=UPI003F88F3FE
MIIERISQETGVNSQAIEAIARTASARYKTYKIRKRSDGFREINQPSPAVKFLQRWVVRNLISHLPVHDCVTSYKDGVGISKNAEMHVDGDYLLKIDFQNFFPSIERQDVSMLLSKNSGLHSFGVLSAEDVEVIADIVCRNGRLTIGAPSSPAISNAILFEFDQLVASECAGRSVRYTRYADDLTFSTKDTDVLEGVLDFVRQALHEQQSPQLKINENKTVFTSRKRLRMVTGLVLTSDKKISIGRSKKRQMKTMCHLFATHKLTNSDASYLRGYLSYAVSVEPSFFEALRRKFGDEVIHRIMGFTLVTRK